MVPSLEWAGAPRGLTLLMSRVVLLGRLVLHVLAPPPPLPGKAVPSRCAQGALACPSPAAYRSRGRNWGPPTSTAAAHRPAAGGTDPRPLATASVFKAAAAGAGAGLASGPGSAAPGGPPAVAEVTGRGAGAAAGDQPPPRGVAVVGRRVRKVGPAL